MKTKFFMLSVFFIVFSTLNCMQDNYVQFDDGTWLECTDVSRSGHYNSSDHSLTLEISEGSLGDKFEYLEQFININKVESLLIGLKRFLRGEFEKNLKKAKELFTSCSSLGSISLKDNTSRILITINQPKQKVD